VQAAEELKIPVNVHICTESEDDKNYKKTINYLTTKVNRDAINTMVTFPVGRALKETDVSRPDTATEAPVSACSSGNSPIIFPDGKVIACIGPVINLKFSHPLVIGNLNQSSVETVFDKAELNPVLHSIRVWGPKKLISLIKNVGFQDVLPSTYMKENPCDACYKLMANSTLADFMNKLGEDPEFRLIVAYARTFYLGETRMAELLAGSVTNAPSRIFQQ
jgi:hypothetical protein